MELHILAQMKGHLLAVFTDLPALGQLRHVTLGVALVTLDQGVVEVGIDARGVKTGRIGRVYGEQINHAHADNQLVGRGLGIDRARRAQRQNSCQQTHMHCRKCSLHSKILLLIVIKVLQSD